LPYPHLGARNQKYRKDVAQSDFIDTFTIWHLRLLDLFDNPPHWASEHDHQFPGLTMGGLTDILISAYPNAPSPLIDIIWADLSAHGLVNTRSLDSMMTGAGLLERRSTDFGRQFLTFINAPA
jgi:hypothetical protein